VSAVEGVCANHEGESPKALMAGARGVGKSTCLRYALNRLLGRFKAVAVIDCDLGQPELTLSGMVFFILLRLYLIWASCP